MRHHGTVSMNHTGSHPGANGRSGCTDQGLADLGGTPPTSARVTKGVAAKLEVTMAGGMRESARSVAKDPGTGPGSRGTRSVGAEGQSRLPKTAVQSVLTARI